MTASDPNQDFPTPAEDLSAEVVIIGAGVAGGLAAWSLARDGHKVLVLDAGPRIDRVTALERFRASPVKGSNSPYENTWYAPQPADEDPNVHYVQAGPRPFLGLYLRGVGGTSWHWTGHAERHYPNDFRMQSAYGRGVDWPISFDDVLPYYKRVEEAWGVAGDINDFIGPARDPKTDGFPLPPVPMSYLDQQIGKAAVAADCAFGPYPHARNSIPHDGRPQCCGNASCRFLCPIAAKYDASVHVTKAEELGARVLDKRVVYHVEVGDDGRVTAVRYRHPDGWEGRATAPVFILAAHAIETPKLLLMSKGKNAPNGVANTSGQVGRNLIALADLNTTALAPKPLYPYRGPVSATGGLKTLRDGDFRRDHAAVATNFVNGGWNATLGPANRARKLIAQGKFGAELNAAIADETAREVQLGSMIDVLPNPDNFIVPDPTATDGLGIPRPRVSFTWDQYTEDGIAKAREMHKAILVALGVPDGKPETQTVEVESAVIAGTTRMGADPATSVVDAHCRSHDHRNLYIIGTGVYPTTGIVSPSMTAAALALRAAEEIHKSAGRG